MFYLDLELEEYIDAFMQAQEDRILAAETVARVRAEITQAEITRAREISRARRLLTRSGASDAEDETPGAETPGAETPGASHSWPLNIDENTAGTSKYSTIRL